MRTGAAAGHEGYFHEAVYYSSDEELLAVLVPFLTGGPAAGEPTVVSLGERNAALVRGALPAVPASSSPAATASTPVRPRRSGRTGRC